MKWYDQEISGVVDNLKTDLERGLTSKDARARLAEYGANELAEAKIVFCQLFHIFDARTFTTLYRRNPFTNRYLLMAVAGSALLSLAVVYLPLGNFVLGTMPIVGRELLMIIAIAALPTLVLSGVKEIFNLRWL